MKVGAFNDFERRSRFDGGERERVVGSEKKASQEGESRGRVRRTSDSDSAVVNESLRSLDRRKL